MAGAGGGAWNNPFGGGDGMAGFNSGHWDAAAAAMLPPPHGWFQELDIAATTATAPQGDQSGSPWDWEMNAGPVGQDDALPVAAVGRRKRRRTRKVKNSEEVESQRITHIAVERNRRKHMNEYLAALRSLMPPS